MKRLLHDIVRLGLAVMLPILMALAPAMAQTVVYQNTTTSLEVVQVPGDTYKWELYSDPTVDFAKVPGNCPPTSAKFSGSTAGSRVDVDWILPGIYFFKVTAVNATQCTNNLKVGMVKVLPPLIDAVIAGATITGSCQNITLDASKSIGDIIKWDWRVIDPGGALTSPNKITTDFLLSPSYKGPLPADFRVSLQVTTRKGETDSDTITIKVDPLPFADIYSNGQPQKDGSMIVDGSVSIGLGLSYNWSTSQGKIVGAANKPTANLLGAGMYTLEVTDEHGCKAFKTFRFPIELFQIIANPDYARTSWSKDTTISVLANDRSTVDLIPGSVRVIQPPTRGDTKVNPDGTVTYSPIGRVPGTDHFIYEVCDVANLCDSALVTIDIYDAGVIAPEAFSPNGDGLNEHLIFKGLEAYPQSHLHIYTRSGQLVYASNNYLNDWDGTTIKSTMQNIEKVPTGVYYYILELGGTSRKIKGFVFIAY